MIRVERTICRPTSHRKINIPVVLRNISGEAGGGEDDCLLLALTHNDPQKASDRRTTTGDSSNDSPKSPGSTKFPTTTCACVAAKIDRTGVESTERVTKTVGASRVSYGSAPQFLKLYSSTVHPVSIVGNPNPG